MRYKYRVCLHYGVFREKSFLVIWLSFSFTIVLFFSSFGKPLVLDMMAVDMLESVRMKFDIVQEGLLNAIMTKEILKDDR